MKKEIHDVKDVGRFARSKAFCKIMHFLSSCSGYLEQCRFSEVKEDKSSPEQELLVCLLNNAYQLVDHVPPEAAQEQRYGNKAFRTYLDQLEPIVLEWCQKVKSKLTISTGVSEELQRYFMESLGSYQRLDYGTGHELSFLGFLLTSQEHGFWDLNSADQSKFTILVIFRKYLQLVRLLQEVYRLEPAGSHGVWGLDDHQFLPYLFGAAQLTGLEKEIQTDDIVDPTKVARYSAQFLYFEGIAFILKMKSGPFFEHSSMLYNISGIATWRRIYEGLLKMYEKEVLGKFPVVQHFLFGSTLSFEPVDHASA